MDLMDDTEKPESGSEAVDALIALGALDDLFARIDAGEIEMTGNDGLIPQLIKAARFWTGRNAQFSVVTDMLSVDDRRVHSPRVRSPTRTTDPCDDGVIINICCSSRAGSSAHAIPPATFFAAGISPPSSLYRSGPFRSGSVSVS